MAASFAQDGAIRLECSISSDLMTAACGPGPEAMRLSVNAEGGLNESAPKIAIQSARLRLRALIEGDLGGVFAILGDEETTASVSWRHPSIEAAKAWLSKRIEDQCRHGISMWAIETRDPSCMVGLCGFFPRGDSIELGYVVKATHWRQGTGQEAVRLAMATASSKGRRVFATIRATNTASIKCAERAGLHRCGQADDARGLLLIYERASQVDAAPEVGSNVGSAAR